MPGLWNVHLGRVTLQGKGITHQGRSCAPVDFSSLQSRQAWSLIIRTLIPNTQRLTTHLSRLRDRSSSTEVVLFERQTFLVIARSHPLPPRVVVNGVLKRRKNKPVEASDDFGGRGGGGGGLDDGGRDDDEGWEESEMDVGHAKRFEKISEMIKSFRMVISSSVAVPPSVRSSLADVLNHTQDPRRRPAPELAGRLPQLFPRDRAVHLQYVLPRRLERPPSA